MSDLKGKVAVVTCYAMLGSTIDGILTTHEDVAQTALLHSAFPRAAGYFR
ncbi:hypothetical protein PY257_04735 [Ramlibacter sp. H39-3-26]|nr:hypothetical protein [Ramlibacter sp. H39-3-26]MDF1484492.1 hypothetical protein [Ramlibacter sp. H39-3-26]